MDHVLKVLHRPREAINEVDDLPVAGLEGRQQRLQPGPAVFDDRSRRRPCVYFTLSYFLTVFDLELGMGKLAVRESIAVSKATQKLPEGAKVPNAKFDIGKPEDELVKAIGTFQKSRDDLEKKLADMQNACSKLKTTIKQEMAFWGAQTFNLDKNAKEVVQARKYICDDLDGMNDLVDQAVASFDDLEKMLEKIDGGSLLPWMKV
jgi:hypothetical protein